MPFPKAVLPSIIRNLWESRRSGFQNQSQMNGLHCQSTPSQEASFGISFIQSPKWYLFSLLIFCVSCEALLSFREDYENSEVRPLSFNIHLYQKATKEEICRREEKGTHKELMVFPSGSDGKESACNAGALGSIPGLGRSPGGGHGNPLQYSYLENPQGQRSLAGYNP